MTKQNNTLVQAQGNLLKLLESKSKALPKNFNQTRFVQNCMAVLQDTKDIQKFDPVNIARVLLKGAFLNLDFFMKECYPIPYGNQLVFQTDYKGEIKVAKMYSIKPVKEIYAKLVREGDSFQETILDGRPTITFGPIPFNKKPVIGAFAVCLFNDGSMLYETMDKEDIEKVRRTYSKVPDGKAWKDSWGEMAKKTVIRRLRKLIQIEFESYEQAEAYESGGDAGFVNELDAIEPVAMPEEIDEDDEIVVEPETENVGRFQTWSEIGDNGVAEALKTLRYLAKEKNITPGDLCLKAKPPIKAITARDMEPNQYWNLYDYLKAL